jgi:uncharacterized repeat protein (TIGR01451 family)
VAQTITDLGGGTSITGPAPNGYAVVAGHFRSAANNPSGLPDLALYWTQIASAPSRAPDLLVSNSLGFTTMLRIISVGTNSTVAVSVANSGPATATNVIVTYNIPAGLQFVQTGSSSQCSASTASQLICAVGSLTAGTSSTALPIVVTSTVSQSASYLSTFTATSNQPEGVPASDATITISLQVNGVPGPQLLTVSPSQGTQGQQALLITLTGRNFQSAGAAVTLSNAGVSIAAGSLSVQNSTTAVVTINIAPTAATGLGNGTFTTAAGQSTLTGAFTPPAMITVFESITVSDAPPSFRIFRTLRLFT